MQINLNIKIKAGKRTPVEVNVFTTSVNEKQLEFMNGKTLSELDIADWIQQTLLKKLQEIEVNNG